MTQKVNVFMISGPVGPLDTMVIDAVGPSVGIAVICHPNPLQGGSNTNKVVQTMAKALSQRGYMCFCPNLRGVGQSAGQHDYGAGEVEDVLAVIEYARDHAPNVPLILAGFSFGGFVAARVREHIEASQLLLVGVAVGKYALPTPCVPDDTLVIHGEEDDVIPLASVFEWARPQSLPVIVLPGTGHFFHGRLVQINRLIQRYLS